MAKKLYGQDKTYVEMSLTLHNKTDKAILVSETGYKEDAVWIPKSQCEDINEIGGTVEIVIPEWLAQDKELI